LWRQNIVKWSMEFCKLMILMGWEIITTYWLMLKFQKKWNISNEKHTSMWGSQNLEKIIM
jgi:hypothetical protein